MPLQQAPHEAAMVHGRLTGHEQVVARAAPGPGASGGAKTRHTSHEAAADAHWMDSLLVAVTDFLGRVSSSTPFSYLAPALLSSTGLARVKLRVA